MSINRFIGSGNLAADAKLSKTSTTGTSVLNFAVAVTDRRKNSQTGQYEDYPNFIDCSIFGTRAEHLEKWLTKGTKVMIEGKLRQSTWETDEGQKRSRITILVDEIEFHTRRNNNEDSANEAPAAAAAPSAVADEDVPF